MRLRSSYPYMVALKYGLFEYLREKPWAVTIAELLKEGKESFLKSTYEDVGKKFPLMTEATVERTIDRLVRDRVISPSITGERISWASLAYLGETMFGISLVKSRARRLTLTHPQDVITLRPYHYNKCYLRMLFEYWDFFLKRNLPRHIDVNVNYFNETLQRELLTSAPKWFQILSLLHQHKRLDAVQLASYLKVSDSPKIWRTMRERIRLLKNKGWPPEIGIVGSRRGTGLTIFALKNWAFGAWNFFMDDRIKREWYYWQQKFRASNIVWSKKTGRR